MSDPQEARSQSEYASLKIQNWVPCNSASCFPHFKLGSQNQQTPIMIQTVVVACVLWGMAVLMPVQHQDLGLRSVTSQRCSPSCWVFPELIWVKDEGICWKTDQHLNYSKPNHQKGLSITKIKENGCSEVVKRSPALER